MMLLKVVRFYVVLFTTIVCLLSSNSMVFAFSSSNNNNSQQCLCTSKVQQSSRRRSFITNTIIAISFITTPSSTNAVVLDNSSIKVGKIEDLTQEEAEQRFRDGRKSLDFLINNYKEICDVGGDNVRRYLGTVGTSSGLFGISKAMKALSERADDIVEYTELSREIEQTIEQADGSAYMSIFVTTSTSYTPPEKYLNDAKIEILRCAKSMDELAKMIDLEL